jgi:hypothetical protein
LAFSAAFVGWGALEVEDEAALAGFADPLFFFPVGCPASLATGCPAALLPLLGGCVASFAAGFGGAPTAPPKVTSASSCSAALGTAKVAAQDKDKPKARRYRNSLWVVFLIASFLDGPGPDYRIASTGGELASWRPDETRLAVDR